MKNKKTHYPYISLIDLPHVGFIFAIRLFPLHQITGQLSPSPHVHPLIQPQIHPISSPNTLSSNFKEFHIPFKLQGEISV